MTSTYEEFLKWKQNNAVKITTENTIIKSFKPEAKINPEEEQMKLQNAKTFAKGMGKGNQPHSAYSLIKQINKQK